MSLSRRLDVPHGPSLRRADVSGWFEVLVDDDGKHLCEAGGRKHAPWVFVPVSPLLKCLSVDAKYVPEAIKINHAWILRALQESWNT